MIRRVFPRLRVFRRSEEGSVTVEFCLLISGFMFLILAGIELALVSVQQAMLERAVDLTVREIRLGTGTNPQHDDIKDAICLRANFIKECGDNLQLEMIRQDAFAGVALPVTPDCTDNSEEVKPVREFRNGLENELMILRACARIDPVFPSSVIGQALIDDTGQYALTSTTAFVQEPS